MSHPLVPQWWPCSLPDLYAMAMDLRCLANGSMELDISWEPIILQSYCFLKWKISHWNSSRPFDEIHDNAVLTIITEALKDFKNDNVHTQTVIKAKQMDYVLTHHYFDCKGCRKSHCKHHPSHGKL